MTLDEIKIGDVVKLKSQEVLMTVENVLAINGIVQTVWFNQDNLIQRASFSPTVLEMSE